MNLSPTPAGVQQNRPLVSPHQHRTQHHHHHHHHHRQHSMMVQAAARKLALLNKQIIAVPGRAGIAVRPVCSAAMN